MASSYDIEPQQPPYTEVQAAEDDGDDSLSISARGSTHLGLPRRASSPVGSLIVEPASAAPSEFDGRSETSSLYNPSSPANSVYVEAGSVVSDLSAMPEQVDAPLTPRAVEDRHLDLPPLEALSLDTNQLPTPTEPNQADDPLDAAVRLAPTAEPDIESAEAVPVLQNAEANHLAELVEEKTLPLIEVGAESEVDAKVGSWAEKVEPSLLPEVENHREVDVEGKIESWVEGLGEADPEGLSTASASDAGGDDPDTDAGDETMRSEDASPTQSSTTSQLMAGLSQAQSHQPAAPSRSSPTQSPSPLEGDMKPKLDPLDEVASISSPGQDEDLKSPIPGSFPDTPTHSGFQAMTTSQSLESPSTQTVPLAVSPEATPHPTTAPLPTTPPTCNVSLASSDSTPARTAESSIPFPHEATPVSSDKPSSQQDCPRLSTESLRDLELERDSEETGTGIVLSRERWGAS